MGTGGAGGMKGGLLATGLLFAGLGHGQTVAKAAPIQIKSGGNLPLDIGDPLVIGDSTVYCNSEFSGYVEWETANGVGKELCSLNSESHAYKWTPVQSSGIAWPDESYQEFRGSGSSAVRYSAVVVCQDKQHFCTLDEKNDEHKINLVHTEYIDGQFIHQGDFVEIYCPEAECPGTTVINGNNTVIAVSAPKPILVWRDDMPLWTLFVNHKREFYIELDIRDRRGEMYTLSRDDSALVGDFDDLQAAKDYAEKLVLSGKP